FAREPIQLDRYSRWGAWEQAILSRLPEPTEAQRLIAERQAAADIENEESQIIEEFFRDQLAKLHYDPDTSIVHIPNPTAAAWLNQATGAQDRTAAATRRN